MTTPHIVIYNAIKTYGRTNDDELWRAKEVDFILARLADAGYVVVKSET